MVLKIEIRSTVVGIITKKWRVYKNYIIGDESYGGSISRITNYKRVMGYNRHKVGHAEHLPRNPIHYV